MAGLPAGVSIMLKSFGIDPTMITGSIEKIGGALTELNNRLKNIETQNTRIIDLLSEPENTNVNAADNTLTAAVGTSANRSSAG